MPDESFDIGKIRKGKDELRFAIKQYKGVYYCDIRLYYPGKDGGTMKPSKEGVTFGLKHLVSAQGFLKDGEELARDRGWLE